ncbi:hypothetical protein PIB30_101054, partial [Stylosanthes scabra]|nr:hypothetical protein [Stylosanthes scabra]
METRWQRHSHYYQDKSMLFWKVRRSKALRISSPNSHLSPFHTLLPLSTASPQAPTTACLCLSSVISHSPTSSTPSNSS